MSEELGQDALERIGSEVADAMCAEIDGVGGREVFFAGKVDEDGFVEEIRVCARGNEESVPAILNALDKREVVLHNHPTGGIAPSEPDLNIAAICARNGHGFYIVDNAVERVYVVVEPFVEKKVQPLDAVEMARVFGPAGRLARILPQFEVRPQQRQMLEVVARAFNNDGIGVIEAPTGVGKTFAYLIPAVLWAIRNKERVVISTRTINLQEQIVFKDIPLLQKCLDDKFTAVLVKGRSNYLCRRKFSRVLSEATLFDDEATQTTIKTLAEWVQKTPEGSRSDLPFMPSRELWERICSEVDTCTGARCPTAKTCFLSKARREIAKADIIIANHHILFSDIALKKDMDDFATLAVLPSYKRVILDEAHSIEDSATEYFGVDASRNAAMALLGRFWRQEHMQERGLIPYIKMKIIKEPQVTREFCDTILDHVDNSLMPGLAAVREALNAAFSALRSVVAENCKQIGRDIKWRLTAKELALPALREVHDVYVLPAVDEIVALVKHCVELGGLLRRIKPGPEDIESPLMLEILELESYKTRLEGLAAVLTEGTGQEILPNTVRWLEIDAAYPNSVRIVRCPLDVGQYLSEWVYGNLNTVIMTSATLSVQRKFDYLFKRLGLDKVEPARLETAILDTPFNFGKQALLCITKDTAAPDDREFMNDTVECLRRILGITKGHALVLFTSFYALDFAHKRLEPELNGKGIAALKQGAASRTQTLDRFRRDLSSVLFATDSFWEGIDVAGDALQCVILPRLPFRVPTEPIQQARAEAVDAAGGNSFLDYTVPQAVIKFRQGFGRLVRRKTDRGTIIVLDRRIVAKFYGKIFLDSLPGIRVVAEQREEVYKALEAFYRK